MITDGYPKHTTDLAPKLPAHHEQYNFEKKFSGWRSVHHEKRLDVFLVRSGKDRINLEKKIPSEEEGWST